VRENAILVEERSPGRRAHAPAAARRAARRTPSAISRPAPTLGQHSDEVLREAGFSAAEIAALREAGALGRAQ
jgi:crotonobetainyl-CoA:carnitine CoA-transferase CaiB-like acyl-CoA transferase